VSVETAVASRRSIRDFASRPVSLGQVSQLLWAAQGVTGPDGKRSAPSAGATYPLEVLVVAGWVEGLPAGVYRYRQADHALVSVLTGDRRADMVAATASGSAWKGKAPVTLVLAGVIERTARRYGERAPRYVHMEVGAATENVHLQAVALDLGTTVVGAFDDERMGRVVGLRPGEQVFALLPVGVPLDRR
jgi:SagB-type dehydrogenase family enzyme